MADGEKKLTEQEYRDQVYAKAKTISTTAELSAFIDELGAHPHDYGTIVYACAAAMKAAFRVVDRGEQGGVTGFQAGCLMWEMVREYGMFSDGPLKILDFDKLRYPQHDDDFEVRISQEMANELSERARKLALEMGEIAHPEVLARNREIASGKFPDFVTVVEKL